MHKNEKTIKELNLEDDFLFAKVMSDREICRKVLEKILDIPIKKVVIPTAQRTIDILFEGKGIRLDVYVNDDKGTVYNVEMQRGKKRELPKRSRYYQGSIDLDLISAGQPYTAITLGDETAKIFLNTKGTMDDIDNDMNEFLTYVENTTDDFAAQANSLLVKEIHQKVTEVKQSKEMEVEYMTLLQRDRENIELGREEGREEGAALAARIIRFYTKGRSYADIAAILHIDPAYAESVIDKYEKDE